MEQPKLQLEAGKYYRTRDGSKAFVAAVALENPFGRMEDPYPVIGFAQGRITVQSWTRDGRVLMEVERSHDLVAEWVEPKRIKGWITITDSAGGAGTRDGHFFTGSITVGHTREEALAFASDNVLACIEIDIEGGQGLEGGR